MFYWCYVLSVGLSSCVLCQLFPVFFMGSYSLIVLYVFLNCINWIYYETVKCIHLSIVSIFLHILQMMLASQFLSKLWLLHFSWCSMFLRVFSTFSGCISFSICHFHVFSFPVFHEWHQWLSFKRRAVVSNLILSKK